jgi:hypothetical protein
MLMAVKLGAGLKFACRLRARMTKESWSNGDRTDRPTSRETFTLVVRVWRYPRENGSETTDWHAQISLIDPQSTSTRHAVGLETIVATVAEFLQSRNGPR